MRSELIEFARRLYEPASAEVQGGAGLIDASVLNDRPGDVFYDLGHVSALGVPVVGEFIASAILARLQDDGSAADLAEGAVRSEMIEQR